MERRVQVPPGISLLFEFDRALLGNQHGFPLADLDGDLAKKIRFGFLEVLDDGVEVFHD